MPIRFRSSGSFQTFDLGGAAPTASVATPVATQVGDLKLVFIYHNNDAVGTFNHTGPAGWTRTDLSSAKANLNDVLRGALWRRVHEAGDADPIFSAAPVGNLLWVLLMLVVQGARVAAPGPILSVNGQSRMVGGPFNTITAQPSSGAIWTNAAVLVSVIWGNGSTGFVRWPAHPLFRDDNSYQLVMTPGGVKVSLSGPNILNAVQVVPGTDLTVPLPQDYGISDVVVGGTSQGTGTDTIVLLSTDSMPPSDPTSPSPGLLLGGSMMGLLLNARIRRRRRISGER